MTYHAPRCPCGFVGNTRNIRAHREGCPAWRAAIPQDHKPNPDPMTPPCPFCKSPETAVAFYPGPNIARVECRGCKANGPQVDLLPGPIELTKDRARVLWRNIRVLAVPGEFFIEPNFIQAMADRLAANAPEKGPWKAWEPGYDEFRDYLTGTMAKLKNVLDHLESDRQAVAWLSQNPGGKVDLMTPEQRGELRTLARFRAADLANYAEAAWRIFGNDALQGAGE